VSARRRPRRAQAKRRRAPLRRRVRGRRLPPLGRILATLVAAGLAGALIWLLSGPSFRVERVALAGHRYTPAATLLAALGSVEGSSLLSLDADALAARLLTVPAIEAARVEPRLDGALQVTVTERTPVVVWGTAASRFAAAADGTLLALVDGAGSSAPAAPGAPAALPVVSDLRTASRYLVAGDRVDSRLVATALQLSGLDPALLGSATPELGLALEDEHGFVLVAPGWRAALGQIGQNQRAHESAEELVERQVAAIRTLFAAQPEEEVSWVDVRNPGKVYWRAKG